MIESFHPKTIEALEFARRLRDREPNREADDPLMWAVIGAVLIALFVLAMSIHWFAG